METIKNIVAKLEANHEKTKQVKLLQDLNLLFLHDYMLEIDEGLVLYPIEVEAYYYHEKNFPDTCVHKYKWQQNRYGQLYFHRAGMKDDAAFLYDGGGIDLCLSYSDSFYLGILIRAAWVNDEEKPICTPGVLTRKVVRHICQDESIEKVGAKEAAIIRVLEEKNTIFKLATNDNRDKGSIVFNSTRFGISATNHPEYAQYRLRSLIELNVPEHPFKAKEKVVLDHMLDNKIEATADNVRMLLGSNSNSILEQLKAHS